MPLAAVGSAMSIAEAARLAKTLLTDPASQTFAAVNGWTHAADRTSLVLMDLFDAYARINFKKPKPLPRPWDKPHTEVLGRETSLTQEEVIAALQAAGHTAPVPTVAA